MKSVRLTWLAAPVLLASCGTEPTQWGPLQGKFTEGRVQAQVVAGSNAAPSVHLSYREPISVAEALWKRVLLPAIAYAQASITIKVEPGALVCIANNQQDVVPRTACVTADALGNAEYEWRSVPTRAGTYKAIASSKKGLEATKEDTVTITIVAGPVNPNLQKNFGAVGLSSPATLHPQSVDDAYGNAVPFRIIGDSRITPQDTTTGSVGARTVTFNQAADPTTYYVTEFRGVGGAVVARGRYRFVIADAKVSIEWTLYGTNLTPP